MIRVQCPKCEKKLGLNDSLAGAVGTCPECGQRFRIPGKPMKSVDKPNPGKTNAPVKKQTVPAKQAAGKAPPSRPKEPWEEEDSSPYNVHATVEPGEDARRVEYGVDKEYEKKIERKRVDEEKKEFQTFIGLIILLIFVGGVVNCLQLIMEDLVYVPVGLGLAVFLVGTGMLVALGFGRDVLQSILVILPVYDIYFTVKHFHEARNPLFMKYIGAITCGVGLYFGGYGKIKGLIEKAKESTSIRPRPLLVAKNNVHAQKL